MNNLDKGTYGNSQCAHDLVDILNKSGNTKSLRTVARIMQDYFTGVRDILKTEHFTETLLKMWVKKHTERTNNASLDIDVKTRVNNIIVAKYREELKKLKSKK